MQNAAGLSPFSVEAIEALKARCARKQRQATGQEFTLITFTADGAWPRTAIVTTRLLSSPKHGIAAALPQPGHKAVGVL